MISKPALSYRCLYLICVLISLCLLVVNLVELDAHPDSSFDVEWSGGEEDRIAVIESDLDRIFNKVSSNQNELQTVSLHNLHFPTGQGVYVTLSGLKGQLPTEIAEFGVTTSLRERRARLHLLVALVQVEGHCLVQDEADVNLDLGDAFNFSLSLQNVTGKGLATLEFNLSSPSVSVSNVLVDYERKNSNMRVTLKRHDNKPYKILRRRDFERIVVEKIWPDLSYHLNSALKKKLVTLLDQEDTHRALGQLSGSSAKLQESVINNTKSANRLVDQIIKAARGIIFDRFNDRIPIPDIERRFKKKILFIPIKGHFVATKGTARGLSTAYRDADTAYSTHNRTTHFYGPIAFSDLNLYYDQYKAKFIGLGPSGTLNTKLRPITIQIHIHIDWRARKIFLDEFKVEQLGKLQVEMTGLSVLNGLFSQITTWVVGWVRDKVVYQLEVKYQSYIREVLSDISVDDLISGKAFKN